MPLYKVTLPSSFLSGVSFDRPRNWVGSEIVMFCDFLACLLIGPHGVWDRMDAHFDGGFVFVDLVGSHGHGKDWLRIGAAGSLRTK
jgi:hypothetical protein